MPESVDPNKLVTLADAAHHYGYNPEHLRQVAVTGRLKAWLISETVWMTTRELLEQYIKSRKPAGRKPRSSTTSRARKVHARSK
ncbi:MAG TPA: hypothetical protein VGP72_24635 [Planctomycetota bacterium]|jgi:hypothetical protein